MNALAGVGILRMPAAKPPLAPSLRGLPSAHTGLGECPIIIATLPQSQIGSEEPICASSLNEGAEGGFAAESTLNANLRGGTSMERKHFKVIGMAIVAAVWLGLAVSAWCRPADEISRTERRTLAQFPEITTENLLNGQFVSDFESYTLDQFPMRDAFRQLKARVHYNVLCQRDNNGIYLAEGRAAKLEYPLNEGSVDNALKVFNSICRRYLQDSNIYLVVVPDKGYYLATENGYPAMDYERLLERMRQGMPDANYVNLTNCLTVADYYRTDTHWRQEQLLPAARRLCHAMGISEPEGLTAVAVEAPFYGVYYGQAALPMKPDTLYTLESDLLKDCRVYNYETGKYGEVYDESKLSGGDLYEVFLSGSVSLLTIENPNAQTDRELIIFRDSYGSSLAPLLVQGYRTVTLVDVRYLSSAMLDRFLNFHGQDVLFLYSTLVLNNSSQLQ